MALISALEAARRYGVSESTALRRAKRAIGAGDTRFLRTRAAYLADEVVWREVIPGPAMMGRPRTTDDEVSLPPP